MEATPRITWLLPVRNAADYLLDALLSMQSQTFTDFEALVIDDGSSDGSLEIAMQLCKDDRRFILHRRAHSGLINTLNFGLAQVRTEFVARMDADDISMPDRLHIQLTYLDTHLNSVAAGSRVIAIDENGSHLYRSRKRVWRDSTYRNFPPNGIALCHPTVTFRTAGVRCAGGYRADFPAAEDYDLWLRLRAFGEIVELPECLLQYRVHSNSVSAQKAEQQLMSRIRAELVAFGRANNLPEDVLDRLTREADRRGKKSLCAPDSVIFRTLLFGITSSIGDLSRRSKHRTQRSLDGNARTAPRRNCNAKTTAPHAFRNCRSGVSPVGSC